MATYLRPDYVGEFSCRGGECGSRCCRDWQVEIDAATCEKYRTLEPEALRREVGRWLKEEQGRCRVELREDGRCPFLQEDWLCLIQREKGAGCLSDICYSYPRVTYRLGSLRLQALTMSCPVAARLLLGKKGQLRFLRSEEPEARQGLQFDIEGRVQGYGDRWQQLQGASLALLQDSRFPLSHRLLALLFFCGEAEKAAGEGEGGFEALLEGEARRAYFSRCLARLEGREFRRDLHVELMTELFCHIYGSEPARARYRGLLEAYERGAGEFRRKVLEPYALPLENYLVNEFFLRLYPFAYGGGLERNARIFILWWKTVEFALRMLSAGKEADLAQLLAWLQPLTDRLDHNASAMKSIATLAEELDLEGEGFAQVMLEL